VTAARTPPTGPKTPKPAGYYSESRANVIAELPTPLGRVLDVGCGEGAAAEALRGAGATWISGIELLPQPAAVAAERYDEVVVTDALDGIDRVAGAFDTVLCYDVLEHLVDPATVVRRLRDVVRDGGVIHVSVPNARHWSLPADLLFRGTFGYTEWGHRDSTHLRWFTRRDMVDLLERSGWRVEKTVPGAAHRLTQLGVPLPRGLVHRASELLSRGWLVLARRADP
jgi:2-polyprenyl-3-methyl-5-hydroxy-6-metoxy-1,4-benzoquinol methylase